MPWVPWTESEVLKLPFDLPNSEAVRQRRINLHRLPGDLYLVLRRLSIEGLHVVESVSKFDDHHAQISRHRQEDLPEVFGAASELHPPLL